MNDRQLRFRVGIFVIVAASVAGAMAFKFGTIGEWLEPTYPIAISFDTAAGLHASTPVKRAGQTIGSVRSIDYDEENGGVLVIVDINRKHQLRSDARAQLNRGLLGDVDLVFIPGRSPQFLPERSRIIGAPPEDPMQIINRMERRMATTLASFEQTSTEWRQVAENMNALMDTNRGQLDDVVENTADALVQFTATMKSADEVFQQTTSLLNDPVYQKNLKETITALPTVVKETRQAIVAARVAVETANRNLKNLEQVTSPLAKHSHSVVVKLNSTLANMESLSSELDDFSKILTRKDGTLQRLASDPQLYRNLNGSAESLAVLLKNMEPMIRDLRIFSDKVARHPELLGVGGALKGSSGLKDPPAPSAPRSRQPIRPARFDAP